MGILDKFVDEDKTSKMTVKDPKKIFEEILKQVSGASLTRQARYEVFYQIIAFKGVCDGVGTSTIVANTALALADLGLNVCVIDTSILHPTQDVLLKSNYVGTSLDMDKRLDWFDMPYTKRSPLHSSTLNNKISILSFYGKQRGITDILSTMDNDTLVQIAITELHTKFDIILIDCCQEMTCVNTTALQMSQRVIQVWNDTPTVVENIDNFITNQVVLSCPLDKMRYVICSKTNPDVIGNLNSLIEQYRLRVITTTVASRDIGRVLCMSKPLWQYPSTEEDIVAYTNSIIEIVSNLLNINDDTNVDTVEAKKQAKIVEDTRVENEQEYTDDLGLLEEEERPKKRRGFFGKKQDVEDGTEGVDYTVDSYTGRKYKLYPEIDNSSNNEEEDV